MGAFQACFVFPTRVSRSRLTREMELEYAFSKPSRASRNGRSDQSPGVRAGRGPTPTGTVMAANVAVRIHRRLHDGKGLPQQKRPGARVVAPALPTALSTAFAGDGLFQEGESRCAVSTCGVDGNNDPRAWSSITGGGPPGKQGTPSVSGHQISSSTRSYWLARRAARALRQSPHPHRPPSGRSGFVTNGSRMPSSSSRRIFAMCIEALVGNAAVR